MMQRTMRKNDQSKNGAKNMPEKPKEILEISYKKVFPNGGYSGCVILPKKWLTELGIEIRKHCMVTFQKDKITIEKMEDRDGNQ